MKHARKSQSNNPETAVEKAAMAAPWEEDVRQCWASLLLEIPLLPMDEHLTRAREICRTMIKSGGGRAAALIGFALNYREFVAIHYRLARYVQPTGEIDRLSPLAGAILLRDELRSAHAASLVAQEELRLSNEGKMEALRKLHEIIKPPRETHRNYQIWIAINEVLKEWAVTQNQSTQSTTSGSSPDEAPFPTTSDVRRWIDAHPADSRFDTIRNLDEKGWFRLREESGINVGEKAFHVLLALAGLSVSDVDMTGWDEFHPTSVLKRGGRGKARND
jgi:hypothetical protein